MLFITVLLVILLLVLNSCYQGILFVIIPGVSTFMVMYINLYVLINIVLTFCYLILLLLNRNLVV